MTYDNFEKDFKKQSISVRLFKYKITIVTIIYLSLILISYLSNKLGYPVINGGVYILGNLFLAYTQNKEMLNYTRPQTHLLPACI